VIVRLAGPADGAAIAAIYRHYVAATAVSFELDPPGADEMARRIAAGGILYPWLVGEADGDIVGYASASAFRARPAYRFAVETSVYLAAGHCGRGHGRALYGRLLALVEAQGFTQAIGAITLPNPASAGLHEALGFAPAGTYRQVGWKCGAWHDVGLWQRALAAAGAPPAEPRPYAEVWRG
jgi:L-amino acid N-acyltransferase YncA